jgi:hypothetical protein
MDLWSSDEKSAFMSEAVVGMSYNDIRRFSMANILTDVEACAVILRFGPLSVRVRKDDDPDRANLAETSASRNACARADSISSDNTSLKRRSIAALWTAGVRPSNELAVADSR